MLVELELGGSWSDWGSWWRLLVSLQINLGTGLGIKASISPERSPAERLGRMSADEFGDVVVTQGLLGAEECRQIRLHRAAASGRRLIGPD